MDHNQSSRFDLLDYDAEGDVGTSFGEQPCLQQIQESRSFSSSDDETQSARSFAPSVGSDAFGEELGTGGRGGGGGDDYGERFGSRGGGWGGAQYQYHQKNQHHQQQQYQQEESRGQRKQRSQHEMNGFGRRGQETQHSHHRDTNEFVAANSVGRNIEREGTHSTLNTTDSSPSHNGEKEISKKMVKIKLWDPGETSSEPTVVTVAMDMLNNRELGDPRDLTLGPGQIIQFCQQRRRGAGRNYNYNDRGETAVDISWLPSLRQEEAWEPPLQISNDDRRIAREDRTARADEPHIDNRRSHPESNDYGRSPPEPSDHRRSPPDSSDHQRSRPESSSHRRSPPESNDYGRSLPKSSDYRRSYPESNGDGRNLPKSNDHRRSPPKSSDYPRILPESSDYQRSPPQSTPAENPVEIRSLAMAMTSIPKTETSAMEQWTESSTPGEAEGELEETLLAPVKGLEPFTIPSVLSSTVIKRTPAEKVGLAFRKATGTVVIEKIVPGSPFDGTALRPGHECLCINGHRLRSARRAAEIVRESGSTLTLVASDAPRPPGTMYTMISLKEHYSMRSGRDYAVGMHFKMKHGLVQLVRLDDDSPIGSTSMKVGDFVLAINGSVVWSISRAVDVLSDSNDDMVPILYFNMRQLRVSLVDKVIGDLWKKEWSDGYDEVVLQSGNGSSNPLTLRFKEEGMCELLDPFQEFGDRFLENGSSSVVPPDHPLNSVVETLNHGIVCVLSAIREGVVLEATPKGGGSLSSGIRSNGNGSKSEGGGSGSLMGELAKLSEMYKEGLLSKDDFEAIKSKLLKS